MEPRSSAPKQGVFRVVLWLFFLQIFSVAAYVLVSFLLPTRVQYLTGGNAAIHVAAAHALMFFVVAFMWVLIRAVDFSRAPRGFPLNRNLAEMNAFITTLANAVLLLCLGVEDWVQQETQGTSFSVLGVIQVLGAAELALVLLSGAGCVWRAVAFLRAGGGAGGPDAAMGEGLLQEGGGGGGRRATGGHAELHLTLPGSPAPAPRSVSVSDGALFAEPASPRLGPLPGGSAQQRLQEVRAALPARAHSRTRTPSQFVPSKRFTSFPTQHAHTHTHTHARTHTHTSAIRRSALRTSSRSARSCS